MELNKIVLPIIEDKYASISNRLVPVGLVTSKELVLYFDMEPVNDYERVPVLVATVPALTSYDTNMLKECLLGMESI